jgi:hypothetical protein
MVRHDDQSKELLQAYYETSSDIDNVRYSVFILCEEEPKRGPDHHAM